MASETNETDEIARKMLQDVSSLVDDTETTDTDVTTSTDKIDGKEKLNANSGAIKKTAAFVYALPGEVLKTSLNRHQRGIMDSRIYQLLTRKEIILSQVIIVNSNWKNPKF